MAETVFLTGGTGFVGANLARLLVAKGYRVRCLARKGSNRKNLEGLPVEIVEGGLLDRDALSAGAKGARFVFHVAADYRIWAPDPAEMYRSNVDGTKLLIECSRGAEKIVVCSSVAAVRPPHDRTPSDENSEYGALDEIVSDYKKSKYLGEKEALKLAANGYPVVVVNPAAPVGALDLKPTPTGKVVVDFLNGRIPSYIDTGMNVVHVADVAEGHLLAALKGRVGERYILGGENMTLKGILDSLASATGLPAPKFQTPYAVAYVFGALDTARARMFGGEPLAPLDAVKMARHYMWFSSAKAQKELGYTFRPAKDALAEAAAWFQANGYAREARAAMTMATQAPILLCAATKWEADPLIARWGLKETFACRYEGLVKGVPVELLKTGIGPRRAAGALDMATSAAFIVSTGFAGALQPKMDSGDLVLDVQGLDLEVPQAARAIALEQHAPLHFGKIAHSDKVLSDPREKAKLGRELRCSAVDMESQSLRAAAERMGVPFLAARVILDAVNERLPSEVPAGEGLTDLIPFALRNAGDLPLMMKLGMRQGRAMKRLADFLEVLLPKL